MKPRFVEDMILVMILLQVFRGSNRILAVYTWRMEDARLIHRELYLGSGHYFLVKRGDWNLRLWNKVLFCFNKSGSANGDMSCRREQGYRELA